VQEGRPPVALTIGVFDGVHRGHQDLIHQMVDAARSRDLVPACVTFDPDPESLLHPEHPCAALSTIEERQSLLREQGVDRLNIVEFTPRVAAQSAEEFIDAIRESWDLRQLWVGSDFALGHDRAGTVDVLSAIGESRGFSVTAVPLLTHEGRSISSTWIRESLADGNVELVATLLGRPYAIEGPVESGARRGRELGFPTANVAPPPGRALPADGVYFVQVHVVSGPKDNGSSPSDRGEKRYGVVNLGGRPTFDESERLLETHVLDFDGDLYGARMRVAFLHQLRGTRKFPSFEDLRLQIKKDVEEGRRLAAQR